MATAPVVPTDIKGSPRVAAAITEVQEDQLTSLDMPMRGSPAPGAASTRNTDAGSLTLDMSTGKLAGAAEDPTEPDAASDFVDEPEATAPEDTAGDIPAAGEPTEPLAEYDPANAEVVAKYEARYFDAKGKLNLAAVTQEFWGNAKDGKPGSLHEDTYRFIEDTLGVTKEAAQAIEAGLVARQVQENSQFWQKVGGKARYAAALEWGKANYTPAQKEAFNKAITGAPGPARDDAVDALLARYDRVNPRQPQQSKRRGPPQRRAVAPERSATAGAAVAGAGATAAIPFRSAAEYTEAFGKAIAAEKNAKTPAERREALAAREKVQADGRRSRSAWR